MTDALSTILSPFVKIALERMLSKTLPDKLNADVEKWGESLPEGLQFNHEALSEKVIFKEDTEGLPHIAKLQEALSKNTIPNSEMWLAALVERWEIVRDSQGADDRVAFFNQNPELARQHLNVLALQLEATCKKDRELFQVSAIDGIRKVQDLLQQSTSNYGCSTPNPSPIVESLSIQIEQLSSSLSKEKAVRLEEYRELYREGHELAAFQKVRELRQDPHWKLFDSPLRAKVLKILASYTLNLMEDKEQAQGFLEEARIIDPTADDSVTHIFLEYMKGGATIALSRLEQTKDVDSFNFKLALLIESGKVDDFFANLESKPQHVVENAETKRLRALGLLLKGRIVEAQVAIESALYDKPKRKSVKFAGALIDYYSALSPVLLPERLVWWPAPVPLSLVKQDDDSVKKLSNAEKTFEQLAENEKNERMHYENWCLASMANLANKQDSAQAYCSSLLLKNPSNPVAVIWAVARNYPFNVSASQRSLERIEDKDPSFIIKKLALIDLYLSQNKTTDAIDLLVRVKGRFEDEGISDTWLVWHAKVLVEAQRPEEALEDAETAKNIEVKITIRTAALREIARKSVDWSPFMKHLEESYLQTGDGQCLYECCQLKAHFGVFDFILDHADELIKKLKNHSAVDIAVKAAWQKNKPAVCLKLLNDNADVYPEKRLPSELSRLRIYCQNRLGLIPQALTDAEALFAEDNATDNLFALMNLQFRKGDLKGLVHSANILVERHDAKPVQLLRSARIVCTEDEELATKLWRRAVGQALTDPAETSVAIEVGFKLGLDKELGPLFTQANLFISRGEGSFKAVDFKNLVAMLKANQKRANFVNEKYNQAEIPGHLLAETLNMTLNHIYHEIPVMNAKSGDILNLPACLVRHGGRPSQKNLVVQQQSVRLHLDISALLLASHLEILDQVEQTFKPLRISASLPTALYQQMEQAEPVQPGRILGYRQLIDLLNDGKLAETPSYEATKKRYLSRSMGEKWTALLENAIIERGFIVDFVPLRSKDLRHKPVKLAKKYKPYVTNRRSLIEALRLAGAIVDEKYREVLSSLDPTRQEEATSTLPAIGSKLYLEGEIAVELALAGVLATVCQRFETFVAKEAIQDAKKRIEAHQHQIESVSWVEKLIYRVRNGLDIGLYEMKNLEEESAPENDVQSKSAAFESMIDLFKFKPQENDVIWIDDRFCNSYSHRDTVPIWCILEILHALREKNVITESEYYRKRHNLRAGNFRFLPLDKGEITYHFRQAKIVENMIVETEELSVLRRYIAAVLLDSARLQTPTPPQAAPQNKGEFPFIVSIIHSIEDAILDAWREQDNSDEMATAYADWLLDNLYVGLFGIRHLMKQDDPNNDRVDLIGLDIGSLLTRAIAFDYEDLEQGGTSRRRKYFEWIDRKIIQMRFNVDPGASVATIRTLNFLFADMVGKHGHNKTEDAISKKLLQLLYLDLPESIKEEWKLDKKIMSAIGLSNIEALKIGDSWFALANFWQKMREAVNGKSSVLKSLGSKSEFDIELAEKDGKKNICIINKSNKVRYNVDDSLTDILIDDPEKRKAILRSKTEWFDCDVVTRDRIIAEVVSCEDVVERIRKADKWRKGSAKLFYSDLEKHLRTRKNLVKSELLPDSLNAILRFVRLEPIGSVGEDFSRILAKSAIKLLRDEGLKTAIARLACLPTRLPTTIVEQYRDLTIENKKVMLNELNSRFVSPVCKLHLIDLALYCSEDGEYANNLVRNTVKSLLSDSDGSDQYGLFKAILVWLNNTTSYSAESREWSVASRLAVLWTHASMLQNIFHSIGAIPEALAHIIESFDSKLSSEVIGRDLSYWNDISHPHRISRAGLLLHGFGSILSDRGGVALVDESAMQQIRDYAEKVYTNPDQVDPNIFIDPVLARDSLVSFLGGDEKKRLSYLGAETLQRLPLDKEAVVGKAVQVLSRNPDDELNWFYMFVMLSDLPIYPELRTAFVTLMKKIDLHAMVRKNPQAGIMALRVVAKQIVHVDDVRMKAKLEEAIVKIASYFVSLAQMPESAKDTIVFTNRTIALGLLDDALSISIKPNSPRDTSRTFSALSGKICRTWPLAVQEMRQSSFRLCQELPAEQLHDMWQLVLTCRAMRMS